MPAFDPSVIIGVAAVAVAVVVPIYLYNRNAEAKRTERLRPFMVQLRGRPSGNRLSVTRRLDSPVPTVIAAHAPRDIAS